MSEPGVSMIRLAGVAARGKLNVKIERVTLDAAKGTVLAIVGAPRDGTSLLLDVIDGTALPKTGIVRTPERVKIARVTLDAPLPEMLHVDEVCALSAALRGDARKLPSSVLGALNLEPLAKRSVRSLSPDERRAVTLAIALASDGAEVLLVEEPLALLAPLATRVVADALRHKAKTACVIVTTSSPRDATRVGDRIAVLVDGVLTPIEESSIVSNDAGSLRVVVAASQGKDGAALLIGALGKEDAVGRVESTAFAAGQATSLTVHGDDLGALAKAVTRAIAGAKIDVDLVEPSIMPLDLIRAQIAAHAVGGRPA